MILFQLILRIDVHKFSYYLFRLPNKYESISAWEDLLLWRSHMFSAISANFLWAEPATLATLQDRPWTSIKMAKTARKKGLSEVGIDYDRHFDSTTYSLIKLIL